MALTRRILSPHEEMGRQLGLERRQKTSVSRAREASVKRNALRKTLAQKLQVGERCKFDGGICTIEQIKFQGRGVIIQTPLGKSLQVAPEVIVPLNKQKAQNFGRRREK